MIGRTLMIQGTSSSAGKSLLVAALCRIFANRGMRVAPFKAQNMSNNAAVCADGAEIGRSQALQAAAARIAPTADMNPVLLKPEADARSQVIVNGRVWKTLEARNYFRSKSALWPVVAQALDRLRENYDLVVIEGAGSPAELNLHDVEIVNMAVARYCQAPVLLVGDIERGGVFAQLLGTLWLLPADDRHLVRGLVINKFRGDLSLFDRGRTILQQRGGVPVLGVVPWLSGLNLPEEDAEVLSRLSVTPPQKRKLDIAVIHFPHLSNFDDFAPLVAASGVQVRYVDAADQLGNPHCLILPGTKSTLSDLAWLRQTGLAEAIKDQAALGTQVVGICGGYQVLGQQLLNPYRIESGVTEMAGLGLLPVTTVFAGQKETHQVRASLVDDRHCPGMRGQHVEGYEIHMGQTSGGKAWLQLARGEGTPLVHDGAVNADGRVWGCYLHGLFANDEFRRHWLSSLYRRSATSDPPLEYQENGASLFSYSQQVEASLNRLAEEVEAALDMAALEQILWHNKEKVHVH
jgi:adenosylcobyric acid synthase